MKAPGILTLVFAACAGGADPATADILNAFQYRNLGPWRTGAWITSLAVPETPILAHRHTMFAGARTGGVWRTTNNGTTWEPVTVGITTRAGKRCSGMNSGWRSCRLLVPLRYPSFE